MLVLNQKNVVYSRKVSKPATRVPITRIRSDGSTLAIKGKVAYKILLNNSHQFFYYNSTPWYVTESWNQRRLKYFRYLMGRQFLFKECAMPNFEMVDIYLTTQCFSLIGLEVMLKCDFNLDLRGKTL